MQLSRQQLLNWGSTEASDVFTVHPPGCLQINLCLLRTKNGETASVIPGLDEDGVRALSVLHLVFSSRLEEIWEVPFK